MTQRPTQTLSLAEHWDSAIDLGPDNFFRGIGGEFPRHFFTGEIALRFGEHFVKPWRILRNTETGLFRLCVDVRDGRLLKFDLPPQFQVYRIPPHYFRLADVGVTGVLPTEVADRLGAKERNRNAHDEASRTTILGPEPLEKLNSQEIGVATSGQCTI